MDRALGVPVAGQVAARELVRAPKGGSGLINSWETLGKRRSRISPTRANIANAQKP
jgi:hypothetical protein